MTVEKQVKELMVNIFDYPHVPYWFSIGQAVQLIKMSFTGQRERPDPIAILVFDEKYNLVGTVGRNELLKGLGPDLWRCVPKVSGGQSNECCNMLPGDFVAEAQQRAEKPVSEVMVNVKHYIEPDEPVTRAAFLMVRHDLLLLPVLEGKKKFVGLIRMAEVFDDLASFAE